MSSGRELQVPEQRVLCPDDVLIHRARLAICQRATDPTEAKALMDMVGIGPGQKWSG